jgi:hypothetical protein
VRDAPGLARHGVGHRRPPFKLTPPDPSEDELQATVASLLRYAFNGQPVVWSHFPAGGYGLTRAAAARLYRLGLQAGFPDLLIQWNPGRSLWIEMKTAKGRASDAQKALHPRLEALGFPVHICRSVEDVLEVIRGYDVPMNRVAI